MDRYRVLRKVGTGSYGSAYLVCSKQDPQQQFVLKKIQPHDATEREKQQAQNEVKMLAKLHHPFVLSYIDDFSYKRQLCIITDYCDHGDLYQYLQDRKRQGKPPPQEAQLLEWFAQLLLALQHVHSTGVLHRDLKTQNIFLNKEGYVKLGDFGISRSLRSSSGMASTCIGTPYYMAPEVLQNLPYDYMSDMWSAGCILFELLSGHQAFDAPDMPSLMAKILAGTHQPMPAHIPLELQVLIQQLLSSDPAQRLSCEAALALPLLQPALAAATSLLATLQSRDMLPGAVTAAAAVVGVGRSTSSRQLTAGRLDGCLPPAAAAAPAAQASPVNSRRSSRSRVLSPTNSSRSLVTGRTAAPAAADASLDEQLQAAQERLRLIQAQREAVREQVLLYQMGEQAGVDSGVPLNPLTAAEGGALPSSSRSCSNRSSCSQLPQLAGGASALQMDPVQLLQQQQQGCPNFVGGSNSSTSAFAAAAQQRRTVSQSHLDNSCCASSAAALAAAAVAAHHPLGTAGLPSSGGLPGLLISPRAVHRDPGNVADFVAGSNSNSRKSLGFSAQRLAVRAASSVAAIEQLLLIDQPNASPVADLGRESRVQQSLPCLSTPASVKASARASRPLVVLYSATSADAFLSGNGPAQGLAALGTECSSSSYAAAAASIPASRQHSESLVFLPSQPGSRRHSKQSIFDYAGPSDNLTAEGAACAAHHVLSQQRDMAPPVAFHGKELAPGLEGNVISSPEPSASPVWCNMYSTSGSYLGSSNSSSSTGSSGSGSAAHVDLIRVRHEATKAEELRRRAAELEQARRSYQLERAAAEVRASSLFDGATACIIPGITPNSSGSSSGNSSSTAASRPLLKHSGASQGQLHAVGDKFTAVGVIGGLPVDGVGARHCSLVLLLQQSRQ